MKIAIDIDSTIYPLLDAMNKVNPNVNYKDCHSWEGLADLCGDKPGQKPIKMFEIFDTVMTADFMNQVGTFEYVSQAISLLSNKYEIHIMTARPDHLYNDVKNYLETHDITYDSLTVKANLDKVELCKIKDIKHLIDDNPVEIANATKAGINVYSMRFPYNQEVINKHNTISVCYETQGWKELIKHF